MIVKTTFLDGIIEEEVYIEKHQGFEISGKESHVCRLKKALYGLKQTLSMVFRDQWIPAKYGLHQK
jgi:hypothetical protein